jgi:glycoside/pentoside/hexuronide:cation symporter, GPH family
MTPAALAMAPAARSSPALGAGDGARYGLLGAGLAFVALPLYVVLPGHYASQFGAPLAALGGVLLLARLLDAVVDPWLGRWVDASLARSRRSALRLGIVAAGMLLAGFWALFFPPALRGSGLLAWCAATLMLTYLGYSMLTVLHQAWGARLGGDARFRARVVSWREGCALGGVMMASAMPSLLGLGATTVALAALLAAGLVALAAGPWRHDPVAGGAAGSWRLPWASRDFRALIALYTLNGVASAIPATLVLFFIRDRLQAGSHEALFLVLYFAAAATSFPLWLRLIERLGLCGSWLAGMVLAVASFVWAATLGAGDVVAFGLVCIGSGMALGADLAAPNALLTGVIQRAGHAQRHEGRYVGWWTAATKLNLALAAGVALPALSALGYQPGAREHEALAALTLAYCALPCVLKSLAALGLWRWWRRSAPQ